MEAEEGAEEEDPTTTIAAAPTTTTTTTNPKATKEVQLLKLHSLWKVVSCLIGVPPPPLPTIQVSLFHSLFCLDSQKCQGKFEILIKKKSMLFY